MNDASGYWVYIAQLADDRLYVGMTHDLERRRIEHASGRKGTRTTRIFGFKGILHSEFFTEKERALKRERQLKGWTRAKKLALATGDIAHLKDLSRRRS